MSPFEPLASPVLVAAEATPVGVWIIYPTLVMLVVAVAVAPVWPWSRRWGWEIAGMFGVTAATAAVFTLAWLGS
jgi:hypothetical protein